MNIEAIKDLIRDEAKTATEAEMREIYEYTWELLKAKKEASKAYLLVDAKRWIKNGVSVTVDTAKLSNSKHLGGGVVKEVRRTKATVYFKDINKVYVVPMDCLIKA